MTGCRVLFGDLLEIAGELETEGRLYSNWSYYNRFAGDNRLLNSKRLLSKDSVGTSMSAHHLHPFLPGSLPSLSLTPFSHCVPFTPYRRVFFSSRFISFRGFYFLLFIILSY